MCWPAIRCPISPDPRGKGADVAIFLPWA